MLVDVTPAAKLLHPALPPDVWRSWNWDPVLILGLLFAGALYARGIRRLWMRAGAGRAVSFGHVAAFFAGLVALSVALVSPLDAMSGALFSAHMVQHVLLMLVVAPLLVIGAPPVALGWMAPQSRRLARWWRRRPALRSAWQALSHPGLIWAAHLLVLWLWHAPALYEAALLDETIHVAEHISFLAVALLYWWALLRSRRLTYLTGAFYSFSTMLLSGLLGVLFVFSEAVWYPAHSLLPYGWGLSPLQDQQLAGVIMWVPTGLVYLAATLFLLGTSLNREARRGGKARVVVAPRQN
jgi:putative membrane protein